MAVAERSFMLVPSETVGLRVKQDRIVDTSVTSPTFLGIGSGPYDLIVELFVSKHVVHYRFAVVDDMPI
jgi:hypothetical protein